MNQTTLVDIVLGLNRILSRSIFKVDLYVISMFEDINNIDKIKHLFNS